MLIKKSSIRRVCSNGCCHCAKASRENPKHLLVCCASCLDQHQMAHNKEECSLHFIGIVDKFYENKWITCNNADLLKKSVRPF